MSAGAVVVVNPNSSTGVTAELDAALDALRFAGGPPIRCLTLAEGPPGIETDAHIAAVIPPLRDLARAHAEGAAAFVIACFSDPGLADVRSAVDVPVLGIARCGLLTAMALGAPIGVISILDASVARHRRLYDDLGITASIAGDRPVGMHVTDLADGAVALDRITAVGEQLVDDGARAVVLGCTGMTRYRATVEHRLGVPVVDPTIAAAGMALARCSAILAPP